MRGVEDHVTEASFASDHSPHTRPLTPHGRLLLVASDDAPPLDDAVARRLIDAFERGAGHGLLQGEGARGGRSVAVVRAGARRVGCGGRIRKLAAGGSTPSAAAKPREARPEDGGTCGRCGEEGEDAALGQR